MSVEQYEALVAAARRREALASVRAEGLEPSLKGLELLEEIAAGRPDEDEAIDRLRSHYQR